MNIKPRTGSVGSARRGQIHRVNKHTRSHILLTYRLEQVTLMSGCRVIVELQWSSLETLPWQRCPKPGAGEQFVYIGSENYLYAFHFTLM